MTSFPVDLQPTRPFQTRATRRAAIGAAALGATTLLGGSAAAQDATPAAGGEAGLGLWSHQLSALTPDEISRLLLEKEVAPVGYNSGLVAAETEFSTADDWPFPDRPAHEVSLGFEPRETGDDFEVGSGLFLIFPDAATAASNLQSIEPGTSGETTIWAVPFAGLDGRWFVNGRSSAIYLLAGPVILIGTDELLADGARTHLMNAISWTLKNIDHVLFHLYSATDEALGID